MIGTLFLWEGIDFDEDRLVLALLLSVEKVFSSYALNLFPVK